MLASLGYKVTFFTDSIKTLEEFQKDPGRYDLVITDMTMPNMTGVELAGQIMTTRPGMPVIICTGFSEMIDEEKAAALGIRALIMKPVIRADLAKAVRQALDLSKMEAVAE